MVDDTVLESKVTQETRLGYAPNNLGKTSTPLLLAAFDRELEQYVDRFPPRPEVYVWKG